jgi:hypothetical protein
MATREFGFICPHFSVDVASNGTVHPGTEGACLGQSLLAGAASADITGRFLLRVYWSGHMVCNGKVEVGWDKHPSQPEPVLAIKPNKAAKLAEAMRKVSGQDVELRLTPIPSR